MRITHLGAQVSKSAGFETRRSLVRKKGLEPLRPCGHQLLRLARLPNSATSALNKNCSIASLSPPALSLEVPRAGRLPPAPSRSCLQPPHLSRERAARRCAPGHDDHVRGLPRPYAQGRLHRLSARVRATGAQLGLREMPSEKFSAARQGKPRCRYHGPPLPLRLFRRPGAAPRQVPFALPAQRQLLKRPALLPQSGSRWKRLRHQGKPAASRLVLEDRFAFRSQVKPTDPSRSAKCPAAAPSARLNGTSRPYRRRRSRAAPRHGAQACSCPSRRAHQSL